MATRWQICQCPDFGCDQQTYRDTTTGEDRRGKAWSAPSFKKHLKNITKKQLKDRKEQADDTVTQVAMEQNE
ncbi:hypothetical protein PGT21_010747, partial [Puccinia graminis f. sp. tritici]